MVLSVEKYSEVLSYKTCVCVGMKIFEMYEKSLYNHEVKLQLECHQD